MRAPVSWLREMVAIPSSESGRDIAERLIRAGLEVETVETLGDGVIGELVVGSVESIEELTEFKKPIRWCQVRVGSNVRGIICGARNFAVGDLVVVAVPGTILPGGFTIATRETYGRMSDGMLCSERELGLGEGHDGIIILDPESAQVGDDARTILGIGEEVLDIAVTPDRGYALSLRGLARELATAYGSAFVDPGLELVDLPAPDSDRTPAACASEDLDACALFTLRTIVGINPLAASPSWMQSRLIACGMRPVSLAVDVTNYVMLETGQPLHAFDLGKLHGAIRAARPAGGEKLETLDHVLRTLSADDLVISDDRGPIGLAGTMGGLETEIDSQTTAIALEAAHFSAEAVARMARRHKISTEASRRFERGVDRQLAPYASARAVALLLKYGGGHYVGMTAVEAPVVATVIEMPAHEPSMVAGMPIDDSVVIDNLMRVGCDVATVGSTLHVTAPSWRADLTDPADLVEEVIRLIGYDNVPSRLPIAAVGHGLTPAQRMRRRVGTMLASRGGVEVLSYPFVSDAELDSLRIPESDPRRSTVQLANPMSDQQPYLRASLLPGLIAAVRRNAGRGNTSVNVFELGSVYRGIVTGEALRPSVAQRPSTEEWQALNDALPDQPFHVGGVLAGERELEGWWGAAHNWDWSDAVAAASSVCDILGVTVTVRQGSDPAFHPGRCAELLFDGVPVGSAGELHPRVVESFGLAPRTCAWEVDLGSLIASAPAVRPAPRVGTQPVAKEDLALVVSDVVTVAAVQQALIDGGGELLESVRLFDVYRGPQVPEGHRSLAFALRFRAADRTLEAAETAAARQLAIDSAAARCGAVLR
jgi:phenylalanyl-tRNA synthetase beta chain